MAASEEKADNGSRWAAAVVAVVYAFGCGLMVSVITSVGSLPLCTDAGLRLGEQCLDASAGAQALSLFAGWTAVALGAVTALLAFAYAIRGGGRDRELVAAGVTAIAAGVLSVLVGSV